MTRISGVYTMAAPCCGARYRAPRYLSMNFSAFEYWTDGWRDGSLMSNDEGLRRCRCGRFLLQRHLVKLGTAQYSDLPSIDSVPDEQLPECIAAAGDEDIERSARRVYWRALNHAYRHRYREHRDAEEAVTKAAWLAAQLGRRTWWAQLMQLKAPRYSRPVGSPLTYPAYAATPLQQDNMKRLSMLVLSTGEAQGGRLTLEMAELYRAQGCFDEARATLIKCPHDEASAVSRLIGQLIEERHAGPVRYKI